MKHVLLLWLLFSAMPVYLRGQVVNAGDYGVRPDAGKDQTDAITALIRSNRGKTVLFPPGTYIVKSVMVNNDIVLTGQDAVLAGSGEDPRKPVLDIRDGNVTVRGLVIDGRERAWTGIYIYSQLRGQVMIDSCTVKNIMGDNTRGGYGIQVNTSYGQVSILHTAVRNIDGPGDGIVGNVVGANRGIYINNVRNVTVEGCTIESVKGYEDGDAIQYYRWDHRDDPSFMVTIRDNVFRSVYKRAVKIQAPHAAVLNNRIEDNVNRRDSASFAAISIYADNTQVEGNTIALGKSRYGIEASGCNNSRIQNNDIYVKEFASPQQRAPIFLLRTNNTKIDNNMINKKAAKRSDLLLKGTPDNY